MARVSRRALLSGAGAVGAAAALPVSGTAPAAAASGTTPAGTAVPARADGPERTGPGGADPTAAARAALRRLLPHHAGQFRLRPLPGEAAGSPDRFRVAGTTGRVEVAGTGAATLLTGVHWYLKYAAGAHLSWAGSRVELPDRLPAPGRPLERRATVPHRFALNDTHDGYTAPYADWPRWERLIDVLALHGCNEVLVTAGQEAVYHRLLQEFGYSGAEARAWLPAPSHQPWWLLQNMSGYGGPVDPALLGRRTELGRRICDRLRELGMEPVLPGYFGTVPEDFTTRNPGARTVPQGVWAGLRRPDWLDPRTPAFRAVAAAFYRHQKELFGPARLFKMDLLHEGGTAGDVPVPEAARAVQGALRAARPDATWVLLGWQANPRRELLDALDRDRTLVVDGLSDLESVTDRERDWGGVPYAFGSIPNFGGRTTLGARTHQWSARFTAWRDRPGSALAGTAYMPEAAERDPAAFELFSELAWRNEPVDRERWFTEYAALRYGGQDPAAAEAFGVLRETAYRITSRDGRPHDSVFAARPSLTAASGAYYATHSPAYDLPAFDRAFAALLAVREPLRRSDAYRHDLTDLARQALANRSWTLIGQLRAAYGRKDADAFRALSRLWLRLMRLSDEMAGCHRAFLLGPWLADARREGRERTARALITTWADRPTADAGHLANYANRDWSGLIADVHLPQWDAYLGALADALDRDRDRDRESDRDPAGREPEPAGRFDWYAAEEAWTRRTEPYPLRPTGDPYRTARRVHAVLARAPYQGGVTVTGEPGALAPGATARVTAVFRNLNGLRATGPVRLALDVPGTGARPPREVGPVPAAGSAAAEWRITVPDRPLVRPVEPLPYELSARYGPGGEPPVTTVHPGRLWLAGPLEPGWSVHTTNEAVFGQLGTGPDARYGIGGGGQDLWRSTAEFGALFRPGGLPDGAVLTVRVDEQDTTGPWARAGLVVRARLAEPGAPGFLTLAVTPANGVVLAYDADGDGAPDTQLRLAGVRVPVLLRLARSGPEVTGSCSTDGGTSWRPVASVRPPGLPPAADAGLFMTAAHGGSGARGTAVFSGLGGLGGLVH
ncbi:alpha-N-acetylglucosaminidase [Streptomyces sp. LP05-1]|uniref:Alpha-N-acetylglucosaminidase n=1 Tax=Streptomyces pyxinae TaxID=2970734 RepID=A0ABT2CG32_9ACTN|nr:alpha-N-acetylglucosaminidase [Streptomyces sp. LP05-1]MCS0636270.1 alpha-N-acetylglucosaminidase [Streptomyces sp. LP05-1]